MTRLPRATRTPRCTYREGSRKCPYDGTGTPALCQAHRIALAQAAKPRPPAQVLLETLGDLLQGNPINREATIGAAEAFLNQWASMGAGYRPDITGGASEDAAHRRAQAGNRPWNWNINHGQQGQGGDPSEQQREADLQRAQAAARQVLGFSSKEPLDADKIKARHRELVKKHHPDLGGSTRKMATINTARDVLMAAIG